MTHGTRKKITASRALFIKLGQGGMWEAECVSSDTLRFGYHVIPHAACVNGEWNVVEKVLREKTDSQTAITSHLRQVKEFYQAKEDVLWITFFSDRLWWAFSKPEIAVHENGEKTRPVIGKWSDSDVKGERLLKARLSGRLLSLAMYRGTICSVDQLTYLLHKLNGTVEPHVAEVQMAYERLQRSLVSIIKSLHPKELEILVDLIFRQSGWQRVGVAGGTEKDVDLDLLSPVTLERIGVQVKSKATPAVWRAYREKFADMRGFTRFYFVTHSPDPGLIGEAEKGEDESFIFWGVEQLASQAVRGGLTGWLLDKAA